MKKRVFGRKFKRDVHERNALFKNLMSDLVMYESIKTTEEKAKSIKSSFDHLITTAKKSLDRDQAGVQNIYRTLEAEVRIDAVKKLLSDIAPRTKDRAGGYTRIMKLGRRFNDDAMVVMMELVDKKPVRADGANETKGSKRKKGSQEATVTEGEVVESTAKKKVTTKPTAKKTARKTATKKETK